jgi:hypothetical protein
LQNSFGSKAWNKKEIVECSSLTATFACAVIPQCEGGPKSKDGWLIKSSFITKDEHEASKLTRTKVNKKNERQRQKNRDRESGPRF